MEDGINIFQNHFALFTAKSNLHTDVSRHSDIMKSLLRFPLQQEPCSSFITLKIDSEARWRPVIALF